MRANSYLSRHGLVPLQVSSPPSPRLGMVVIIPCHDEPDPLTTLDSLWSCERPVCDTEVLLVINGSDADPLAVREHNHGSYRAARAWIRAHQDSRLRFHLLYFPRLPRRRAGVGLARKLGMDEAVARLRAVDRPEGLMVSLDADCRCQPNYLVGIHEHFARHPRTPGCSISFEHPVDHIEDPALRLGITRYELYLRYYVHGLRYARSPYAFHTIGSCMAVRCEVYERQGGMNRRQAGEDFYFLQKVIPLGGFTELRETTVMPAARLSHRVPFGTGQALARCVDSEAGDYSVCTPTVFSDLRALLSRVDLLRCPPSAGKALHDLSPSLQDFLRKQAFTERMAEMREKTASPDAFKKRFFLWFNALRTFKYVRFATRRSYREMTVEQAALTLLRWRNLAASPGGTPPPDAAALLARYRELDRQAPGDL